MNPAHNPYGSIPAFFAEECAKLSLPLATVVDDTAGFVAAVLAIPDRVRQVHVRRYIDLTNGFNYLRCYLQTLGGLSGEDAGRVANTVLLGVSKAGISPSYRDIQK